MEANTSLLRKYIFKTLTEAVLNNHFRERLNDRVILNDVVEVGFDESMSYVKYNVVGRYSIPQELKDTVLNSVNTIEKYNFPKNKSYGIKILHFIIDKNKVEYFSDELKEQAKNKTLIFVDSKTNSNGNVIYAIIRDNSVETLYFGKSYLKQTPEKLRVDAVVNMDSIQNKKLYQ
jgi:hypothetical protein